MAWRNPEIAQAIQLVLDEGDYKYEFNRSQSYFVVSHKARGENIRSNHLFIHILDDTIHFRYDINIWSLVEEQMSQLYELMGIVNKKLIYSKMYIDTSEVYSDDNVRLTFEIITGFDDECLTSTKLVERYLDDLIDSVNKYYRVFKEVAKEHYESIEYALELYV